MASENGKDWPEQLRRLRQLPANWNGHGAPAPDVAAIRGTERVLRLLRTMDFEPEGVLPMAQGGVAVVFSAGNRYADLELFNTGKVRAFCSEAGLERQRWKPDLDRIEDSLERIRAYIQGKTSPAPSEVDLIAGLISRNVGYEVGFYATLWVRPMGDGTYAVICDDDNVVRESQTFFDPYLAARFFLQKRAEIEMKFDRANARSRS